MSFYLYMVKYFHMQPQYVLFFEDKRPISHPQKERGNYVLMFVDMIHTFYFITNLYLNFLHWDSVVSIVTRCGLDLVQISVGVKLFLPVQTDPSAHPASCTVGTSSLSRGKRPGHGGDNPHPSSTEVKKV
jgi:hypothetical protein